VSPCVEVEPSGRWRPCPEEGRGGATGAWVPAEAMNGVVLGIGGTAGAYTRPHLSSTRAVSDTKAPRKPSLIPLVTPLMSRKQSSNNPPIPQKRLR